MPRARAADSFVWRAAARPERARLLGAIAIAMSCGGLGVVAGRWSAQVAPDPRTRTAALIEAVSKETQAKLAVPKPPVQAPAPAAPAPVAPPVTRAPAAAPEGGQAPSAPAASARAPESAEEGAAEPPRPIVRPPSNGTAGRRKPRQRVRCRRRDCVGRTTHPAREEPRGTQLSGLARLRTEPLGRGRGPQRQARAALRARVPLGPSGVAPARTGFCACDSCSGYSVNDDGGRSWAE